MRTVIVGTTGQLATELHRQRPEGDLEVEPPRRIDIADAAQVEALLGEAKPQLVINASAYTAVDKAEQEPARAHAVNAEGPAHLARWCSKHGAALIHISTDYVFDGQKTAPYVEDDVTAPINVYGQSKLAGEQLVRQHLERHVIIRTSWVFSAHGQNFVKTMRRLSRERDELRVVADQHGRPTSAADLAKALWRISREHLCDPGAAPWGTYHLANAEATSWHGLAQAVVALESRVRHPGPTVTPIAAEAYPTPATRPSNSVLDTTRFETTFGFGLRPFQLALREVMDELQSS